MDPFNPENGYNPKGASKYSDAFKRKYFKAQADRMNKLIDEALRKVALMKEGKSFYPDDDVFVVVGGGGARLMELDLSIHHSTVKTVNSVRRANPSLAEQSATFENGARLLTVRSFLSANATRATDSMDGIDDCSTNNSTPCALRSISVPVLIAAMGAHYFIRDNEIHYEVASKDKDFVVIEGATHGISPCVACRTDSRPVFEQRKEFF